MIFNVGDHEVAIDGLLAKKLDLMCDRVTKQHPALDAFIENTGDEGQGKTNVSITEVAYVKMKTGRSIHLFFKTSSALRYMQAHENALVILDEPAFETLSSDALTRQSKDFLRLTSTMRKMRHFLIINFTKFWKFPEFLVVDRALGMVYLYSKDDGRMGCFRYIKKRDLEKLWNDFKKLGLRNYGKYTSFKGHFAYTMEKIFETLDITVEDIPHATFADYNREKDKAIASIGEVKSKKESKMEAELRHLKFLIANIQKEEPMNDTKLSKHFKIQPRTLREWRNLEERSKNDDENSEIGELEGTGAVFKGSGGGSYINNTPKEDEIDSAGQDEDEGNL